MAGQAHTMIRPGIALCAFATVLAVSTGAQAAATSARGATGARAPARTTASKFNPVSPLVMPLWEVNAQNLTCDEINQIREKSMPGERDPSIGQVMGYIANLPQHSQDKRSELFGPILDAWATTADLPGQTFNVNPGAMVPRPGEIKMLGYLDFAARQRNC